MQNRNTPRGVIERNRLLLAGMVLASTILCWGSFVLFRDMVGYAFAIAIPAVIVSIHTLWMLLTPFATIYEDRAELRPTWIHHRDHFFNDLESVFENRGGLFVAYHDGEQEKLKLFGIRRAHLSLLKENFSAAIAFHKTQREL